MNLGIDFVRGTKGIGDLSIALRAMELVRLEYPRAYIRVFCKYGDLIRQHPALNEVHEFSDMRGNKGNIIVNLVATHNYITKHEQFCNNTTEALMSHGLEGIKWDGKPQSLWVNYSEKYEAWKQVRDISQGKISVGIFWRSSQERRDWKDIFEFVKILSRDSRFSVFCFDHEKSINEDYLPIHNFVGLRLDKVIALVSCMDIVVGVDSAGLHIAGGLGIPILGIFGSTDPEKLISMYNESDFITGKCKNMPCWFNDCYNLYSCMNIEPFDVYEKVTGKNFPKKDIPMYLPPNKKDNDLWDLPSREPIAGQETAVVIRHRGIGDVRMTWFAIDQYRKENPHIHITYITNPASAALFCGQKGLVDKVIPFQYNHPAHGDIIPPPPINVSTFYDNQFNLINRVDFGDITHKKPRADNFADLMGVILDKPVLRPLMVNDEETKEAMRMLDYNDNYQYVICQVNADGKSRVWNIIRWLELAWKTYEELPKVKMIMVSNRVYHGRFSNNIINLTGMTTVRQYIALTSLSKVLISTDTAGLHIGSGFPNLKVIGLFGSTGITDSGEYAHTNYYSNVLYINSRSRRCKPCWDRALCSDKWNFPVCLWDIKAKTVVKELKKVLDI